MRSVRACSRSLRGRSGRALPKRPQSRFRSPSAPLPPIWGRSHQPCRRFEASSIAVARVPAKYCGEVTDNDLRNQLGKLVRQLVNENDEDGPESIRRALREHLGDAASELAIVGEELEAWELPNLQLALDEL